MISAHSIADRITHRHRRPSQRRSHHDLDKRGPIRTPGRGASSTPHFGLDDDIERVVIIPARPKLYWPVAPPSNHLGQLEDSFQLQLIQERSSLTMEDCIFTQSINSEAGKTIDGLWDIRGREEPYLGVSNFQSRRVLELGPQSGYLTSYMASQGAQVVGFDIGYDLTPDVIVAKPEESVSCANELLRAQGAVQNSWWYHKRIGCFDAKMVYGDIYHLPADLGMFDISIFPNYLSFLRDPWEAMSQAASITRKRIVVTEVYSKESCSFARDSLEHVSLWAPGSRQVSNLWWAMSPGSVVDSLRQLGFTRTRVTLHNQLQKITQDSSDGSVSFYSETPMFTVVADREWSI